MYRVNGAMDRPESQSLAITESRSNSASSGKHSATPANTAPLGKTRPIRAILFDKDGTPFTIYAFAPAHGSSGSWKTVGYSEEGGTLLAFTLTARSKAAHDQGLPVFTETIHKYAREIPW